jgi:hypothetical protein
MQQRRPRLTSAVAAEVAAAGGCGGGRHRAGRRAQAQTGTPPPAVAQGETPAAVVPDAAPRQGLRRYKVNLPPSASFDMTVDRVDADGTKWTGSATMTWHTDGSRYAPRWKRASAC